MTGIAKGLYMLGIVTVLLIALAIDALLPRRR